MRSIISNNCWGAGYYQAARSAYKTPTIGLWFYAEDYLTFLRNLRDYLDLPISLDWKSKSGQISTYPVGLINNEVEIQFLHYTSLLEAEENWNARRCRVAQEDKELLIKICDRDGFIADHLHQFDALTFQRKIAFVKHGKFNVLKFDWVVEIETQQQAVPDGATLWEETKAHPAVIRLLAD